MGSGGLYKFKFFIEASDHRQEATAEFYGILLEIPPECLIHHPILPATDTTGPWLSSPDTSGHPHLCSSWRWGPSHLQPHLGLGALHVVALDVSLTSVDINGNGSVIGGSSLGGGSGGPERVVSVAIQQLCLAGLVLTSGCGHVGGPETEARDPSQAKGCGVLSSSGNSRKWKRTDSSCYPRGLEVGEKQSPTNRERGAGRKDEGSQEPRRLGKRLGAVSCGTGVGGRRSHRPRGTPACVWSCSFCSRFSFCSCFLSSFFFREMRLSTSTPH